LAILECWQYNIYRSAIHMMPEDTLQAAHDLQAKQLLPVHWWKFPLSLHSWYEPIDRLITANSWSGYSILTPWLGEVLYLNGENTTQQRWKNID
jgi:L-ascorbate metabolism protein UlaG (beta-lactamase superfamily)